MMNDYAGGRVLHRQIEKRQHPGQDNGKRRKFGPAGQMPAGRNNAAKPLNGKRAALSRDEERKLFRGYKPKPEQKKSAKHKDKWTDSKAEAKVRRERLSDREKKMLAELIETSENIIRKEAIAMHRMCRQLPHLYGPVSIEDLMQLGRWGQRKALRHYKVEKGYK